ncbi:MAG: phage tail protein [Intrasporangiaceae bacterium]|nr:phage tail protein [Intrasporangiaceae bacterium]
MLDVENEQWIRAGDTIGLATENHAYGDRLFHLMPQFMQVEDFERRTAATGKGPLHRYLDVVGMSLDHLRTEYETLRWMRNPDRISGGLIWPLAEMFGIPFEPAIGMRQARVWLRDSVYLYKIKGTRPGVEAAASAMTGWGARVTQGKNLFRAEGVPNWYSDADLSNTTAPDNSQVFALNISAPADESPFTLRTVPLLHVTGISPWFGISVEELTDYAVSGWIRPPTGTADGRGFVWKIEWYDVEGGLLSSDTGAVATTLDATWVEIDHVANSPAGSQYAVISLEDQGTGATELLLRDAQFEKNLTPTSWEPARAIIINFDPVRWNLGLNPAFGNGLFGWDVVDGTTTVEEGEVGPAGSNKHAEVDGTLRTVMLGLSTPGVSHVFSAYTQGTANVTVTLQFFAEAGDEVPVHEESTTWSVAGDSRVHVSTPGPSGSFFVRAVIQTSAEIDVGATLLEEGSVPGDYFDGDFFGADYLWAGMAGTSASKYYPARAERNHRVRELIPDYLPISQRFIVNYVGGAPSSGQLMTGDEGDLGVGAYGIMPFGE